MTRAPNHELSTPTLHEGRSSINHDVTLPGYLPRPAGIQSQWLSASRHLLCRAYPCYSDTASLASLLDTTSRRCKHNQRMSGSSCELPDIAPIVS